MAALAPMATALCLWMAASLSWSAIIATLCESLASRRTESWPSYWLAVLALAIGPTLAAPLLLSTPAPLFPLQVDAAVALAEWTAPLQNYAHTIGSIATGSAILVAAVFCGGLAARLWRLNRERRRVFRILRDARPETVLSTGEAASIVLTEETVSIFCVGGSHRKVVLPRAMLGNLSPAQVRMIIAHETAHLRRGDPFLFAALACLEAVFWFNPFVRRLADRTRLAAEIACDAVALGDADVERKAYASALISALDRSTDQPLIAAFGRTQDPRVRLSYILSGAQVAPPLRLMSALIVCAALLFSFSGTALAGTTMRMAIFGDAALLQALSARAELLYGSARCAPIQARTSQ